MSSKAKLLQYLLNHIGKTCHSRELQNAAGGAVEFARRLRELRAEGWPIETHRDDSALKPGEWVLRSDTPGKPVSFSTGISKKIRARVLERNGYTCQMCGVAAGEIHPHNNRKTTLHIGHITDKSMGGADTMENLRALCSVCNEGAQNITPMPPKTRELLAALRRADRATQLEAYKWLEKLFNSTK